MNEYEILFHFENYLDSKGYCPRTTSGLPSTTYDYSHPTILFVLKREKNINTLISLIDDYIIDYDEGDSKERKVIDQA